MKEFPTEPFTVSHGQLFCSAFRELLSLKRSILKNHVESLKHRNTKDRLACGNNWIFNWIRKIGVFFNVGIIVYLRE